MLGTLIASIASVETAKIAARIRRAAMVYAIAAVAALIGLAFLLVAAYLALSVRFGPIEAALGFGGGFLLVAILALAIHKITSASRQRRRSERRSIEMKSIAGAAALTLLPMLLKRGVGLGAVVLPLAGLAAYAIFKENSSARDDD